MPRKIRQLKSDLRNAGFVLVPAAGLAKGKRFTCYEHVKLEVEAVGGHYVAAESVTDGRLVSSPTWREQPAFYRDVFACLQPVAVRS